MIAGTIAGIVASIVITFVAVNWGVRRHVARKGSSTTSSSSNDAPTPREQQPPSADNQPDTSTSTRIDPVAASLQDKYTRFSPLFGEPTALPPPSYPHEKTGTNLHPMLIPAYPYSSRTNLYSPLAAAAARAGAGVTAASARVMVEPVITWNTNPLAEEDEEEMEQEQEQRQRQEGRYEV